MATLSRQRSKDMYSWWWDSHISPKNSRWLKENLTDMDTKVKIMIKLIEVDEDSFARRAEMYYKKRPELMKLVEEFYRAYRALAERYDHATGVIRQAHKTMAEAFPNQVPFLMTDDGPMNSAHDSDPHTPDELQNGDFSNEPDLLAGKKGSKQLKGLEKARKGLNFSEVEERGETLKKNDKEDVQTRVLSESERLGISETDVRALKETLAKLEAEKEAGLLQYQHTLERLSKLESEVAEAKEDSRGFNERARKAEAEVLSLKESLAKVEAEREASLLQYQQCLDRISNLESHISRAEVDAGQLSDRASNAEKEVEDLKEELTRLKDEKEALLAKYMESLEKIANLENKLLLAEDYASRTSERADRAEKEVETLRETITRLSEEKEAAILKYEQCLEKIAALEREIARLQGEAERLKAEVEDGVAKLKGTEEQCLLLDRSNKSLRSEVDSLNQELSGKQKEMGQLWTCVQEERMRFMEAETAFQSLQNLHSKVQEELRSVAGELQKNVQLLKDMEVQKQRLEDDVTEIKDENKSLNDINLSSAESIKSMQEEIFDLKEGKGKLEQELELRIDQRNALQQEIYCLKEEVNNLSGRHRDMLGQVESVGLDPEAFGSLVKHLKGENSKLRESCQRSEVEIAALVEKLGVMEKLVEKNEVLENSLADLSAELEGAREKVKALEETCKLLMGEKSTLTIEKAALITQLQVTTENLEKVAERNTYLENSLSDANAELETLRAKSKNLEDSCLLLNGEKTALLMEKQTLTYELETTHQRLEDLGKRHTDLEKRFSDLEEERESTGRKVEELQVCLDVEMQEHNNSNRLSQARIADLENQIRTLQEVGDHMREEFEQELDKAVNAQFEIFILQKCIQDIKEKNFSLLRYCEKLLEASKLSETLISELEHENLEQQEEVRMLSSQVKELRMGMIRLLDELEVNAVPAGDVHENEDQRVLHLILGKLNDMKDSLYQAWDENQELGIQKSVLVAVIWQLKHDVTELNALIVTLRQEIGVRNEQLAVMQKEMQKLLEDNEELVLKVREGNQKEVVLLAEMENLREKLLNLQMAYDDLQKEHCKVIKEKESLMNTVEDLKEEKHNLEHECSCIVGEAVALDNLSFVFKNVISEKSRTVIELVGNIDKLCDENGILEEKLRVVEGMLEEAQNKNIDLVVSLEKSVNELEEVRVVNDQLKGEINNGKDLLCLKEMELSEAEALKVHQESQILKLSENFTEQFNECEGLHKVIENLESQVSKVQTEHKETEERVGFLSSELQKGKDELILWETLAGTLFTELQSSNVCEALIKDKFSELVKGYEILEEQSYSKGMDIVQLRERVGALEGENTEIKSRMAADISTVLSLRDSVASLEKHTIWQRDLDKTDYEKKEDAEFYQNSSEDKVAAVQLGGLVVLRDVQSRIQAVEKAVIELKRQAEEEYSGLRSDLDSAMRQIQVLKPQSTSRRGSGRSIRHFAPPPQEDWTQKLCPDNPEPGNELLMKDIMLDQASDCSSFGKNRRIKGSGDQILEVWKTVDRAGSIDLTVGNPKREHLEAVKEGKSSRPSSESLVVKELGVDEQEGSKRFPDPQHEDYKRKTLERLASDVQKLTNLQITVQDLKEKVEMADFSSKGKGIECDGVKDQLLETEKTILKLFEYSGKLMKKVENSSSASSFDGSLPDDSSDGENARRKRCSEQARRISEKIGRMQLEVQKVQFLLMKLDSNKAGKGGTRITERNTRVLLQDYLYGGIKTPRSRKKAHFCGCMQPPTSGD